MRSGVIATLLVVAILAGAGAGYLVGHVTSTSTLTAASTTSPCGSPGVYCGGFNITSASLTVNGSNSVLQVTIRETGNMYIGSATVYVNGTVIGNGPASSYLPPGNLQHEPPGNLPLNVQPGEQAVLVFTIPNSTISVKPGMTYSVLVYAWEGPPGQRASAGDSATIVVKAN
jgi:archaellum component FlaF (FlaF/FlaG flagellin family)